MNSLNLIGPPLFGEFPTQLGLCLRQPIVIPFGNTMFGVVGLRSHHPLLAVRGQPNIKPVSLGCCLTLTCKHRKCSPLVSIQQRSISNHPHKLEVLRTNSRTNEQIIQANHPAGAPWAPTPHHHHKAAQRSCRVPAGAQHTLKLLLSGGVGWGWGGGGVGVGWGSRCLGMGDLLWK